ncbi:MAG: flagellar basal body rod protein FlgC [Roseovarius sp.]|uniref:flagellar basal body rod protein FlgC n=1 Tax=Roseovarius sp. TaxID=1486281 RepID=UPI0032F035D9
MIVKNVFDVAKSAMSAQMVRLNTVSSNMANAQTVSDTKEGAYRPLRPVFETVYGDQMGQAGRDGLSTTRVREVVTLDREPVRAYRPDHPMADEEGFVYESVVNTDEEMVEMLEASRQYQNVLETVSTLRTLMARTVKMGQ